MYVYSTVCHSVVCVTLGGYAFSQEEHGVVDQVSCFALHC